MGRGEPGVEFLDAVDTVWTARREVNRRIACNCVDADELSAGREGQSIAFSIPFAGTAMQRRMVCPVPGNQHHRYLRLANQFAQQQRQTPPTLAERKPLHRSRKTARAD